jgi:tetratricopeptide (TPR) repeat protein
LGKLDEAISDITKEIELYPGNFLDIHTRCELYIVQGKIDEALADVNGLWAITPPEMVFAIYTLRLWANSKKGKWQEALHDANRAVEANPEHPSMYINRARVYEKLAEITKKKKEKTEYQRRAREDQVTHDKVMAMWGEKLGQKGQ